MALSGKSAILENAQPITAQPHLKNGLRKKISQSAKSAIFPAIPKMQMIFFVMNSRIRQRRVLLLADSAMPIAFTTEKAASAKQKRNAAPATNS